MSCESLKGIWIAAQLGVSSESETGKGTGKEDTRDVGKTIVRKKVGGGKVSSKEIKS